MSWRVLESETLYQSGFITFRAEKCQLPDGRIMPRYFRFDFPDWVNVVALTEDGKIIMVRQYRHGAKIYCLEIPGGSTDPRSKEDVLSAAGRELREESGHTSEDWKLLGHHYPNPALQGNRMYTALALNCRKTHDLDLDPFEDLEVQLLDPRDLFDRLDRGEIVHSLIIASLSLARPELNKLGLL